jgi:hypothetical protein
MRKFSTPLAFSFSFSFFLLRLWRELGIWKRWTWAGYGGDDVSRDAGTEQTTKVSAEIESLLGLTGWRLLTNDGLWHQY